MSKLTVTAVREKRRRIHNQLVKLKEQFKTDEKKLEDELRELQKQCRHRKVTTCYGPDDTIWCCDHCDAMSDNKFGRSRR